MWLQRDVGRGEVFSGPRARGAAGATCNSEAKLCGKVPRWVPKFQIHRRISPRQRTWDEIMEIVGLRSALELRPQQPRVMGWGLE